MKKIMFNDEYGLTQAVIDGTKPMTRRVITDIKFNQWDGRQQILACDTECNEVVYGKLADNGSGEIVDKRVYTPRYHVGEVVAVAQPYKDVANTLHFIETCLANGWRIDYRDAGWNNKMFVKPCLMPHQIRITDIKIERLQDCSDDDILKEGVFQISAPTYSHNNGIGYTFKGWTDRGVECSSDTPKGAFKALINKTCGRGTFDSNPWVVAYSFELVK